MSTLQTATHEINPNRHIAIAKISGYCAEAVGTNIREATSKALALLLNQMGKQKNFIIYSELFVKRKKYRTKCKQKKC